MKLKDGVLLSLSLSRIGFRFIRKPIVYILLVLIIFGTFLSSLIFVPPGKKALAANATDTFTGVAGTLLENHTSDSGNTWTKNIGTTGIAITDSNRVRGTGSTPVVYTSNWIPSLADYDISSDIYIANESYNQTGVGGRIGTGVFTGYYALLTNGPSLKLYRAGNVNPLATYNLTVHIGETHNLKLSMRGNNIVVYWDSSSIINITAAGSDIINDIGMAGVYSAGTFTNTTGPHLDNFLAVDAPLTAGVLSELTHSNTSATLSWTNSIGGTAPITSQLQSSPHGTETWSDVASATSSPATDSGLDPVTTYDYRVAFTDAIPNTVYSNTVSITTSNSPSDYYGTIMAEANLLNYWPMNEAAGATSLGAAVGGTAINLTGGTAGVSGQTGTAVSFDGTNDFGVTASNLDLTSHNKVVVEALMKYSYTDQGFDGWEFSPNVNSLTTGFMFAPVEASSLTSSNLILKGNGGYNYSFYSRPSADSWHHIVTVFDKGAATDETAFYVDGQLQSMVSQPASSNNTNTFGNNLLYLMSRGGTSLFGQGEVQHLAIYSDLGADRILAHYQEAFISGFTGGTLSEDSHSSNSDTLSWTDSINGNGNITSQLQKSPHGAGTWSDVASATSSPATDLGLDPATSYDYRVAYTDETPETVYSNTITITTDAGATTAYTVQPDDLWDNGYDNVSAPRQSTFARFVLQTDAPSVTITGTTTIFASFPQYAHLGIRVDGVDQSPLAFTANGSQNFSVDLGVAGTTRTVEVITGLQSKPGGSVIGSFIDSITYPDSTSFKVQTPVAGDRVLVYGDSISVGGNATNAEYNGYIPLLRNTYGYRVMLEGWGYRSLYEDANTAGLRSAFVSRIAGYSPSTIWLAIGTNDYGLNKWNAANFGTAYAATIDDLHTALPNARIICQTPIVRSSEGANGSGNTLGDYRTQISNICGARDWAELIDGSVFLTTGNLADGVHPSTAGHAKYAKRIAPVLASPSYTVSGPSTGKNNAASSNFTVTIGSAVFLGDQTITLAAPSGTISATAAGGTITNNNTSAVEVTPTADATTFTFTYTPTSEGAKALTFTNDQGWGNPVNVGYLSDSSSPNISDGLPSGILASNITSASLAIATNENATCKYSATSGVSYSEMGNTFSTTGGTTHSTAVSGLSAGNTYHYYVRCQDEADNVNSSVYAITFQIASKSSSHTTTDTSEPSTRESTETQPTTSTSETTSPSSSSTVSDSQQNQTQTSQTPETTSSENNTANESIIEKIEKFFKTRVLMIGDKKVVETVKFQVVDKDGKPISNLDVTIHSEPQTAKTNENGVVTFSDVPVGKHTLAFSVGSNNFNKKVAVADPNAQEGTFQAEILTIKAEKDPTAAWVWWVIGVLGFTVLVLGIRQIRISKRQI